MLRPCTGEPAVYRVEPCFGPAQNTGRLKPISLCPAAPSGAAFRGQLRAGVVDVDSLLSPTVFDHRLRLRCQPSQPVSKGFPQRPSNSRQINGRISRIRPFQKVWITKHPRW